MRSSRRSFRRCCCLFRSCFGRQFAASCTGFFVRNCCRLFYRCCDRLMSFGGCGLFYTRCNCCFVRARYCMFLAIGSVRFFMSARSFGRLIAASSWCLFVRSGYCSTLLTSRCFLKNNYFNGLFTKFVFVLTL